MVSRQTFFWARVNYLLSLQAVVSGGDYQTAAMLPLGLTDCSGSHEPGVALYWSRLCWNPKVVRSHQVWGKQLHWTLGCVKKHRRAKTELPLLENMQPGSQPWHFRIVFFRTRVSCKDCSEQDHFLHIPVCMPKASGAVNVYVTFCFNFK